MAAGRRLLLLVALAAGSLAPAASAEPSLSILPLSFTVREFRGPETRAARNAPSTEAYRGVPGLAGEPLVVLWGETGGAAVTLSGRELKVAPARRGSPDLSALDAAPKAIPSSRSESAGPLTVSLVEPTNAYRHEALGSSTHAAALAISERRPAAPGPEPRRIQVDTSRIEAGPDAVFEDREPRLVEGRAGPFVAVIRSYRDRGSALAIVGRRDGAWTIMAETPADGEPFRWLNPAAFPEIGGERAILLVRRPHLDGVLQFWRWAGGRLTLVAEKPGYSNHAFGQAQQGLAATFAAEGGTRLALPTIDRRALAILEIRPDGMAEIARVALPARASTGVAAFGRGAETHLLVGLEDGRVADVRP